MKKIVPTPVFNDVLFTRIKSIDLTQIRAYLMFRLGWKKGRINKAIEDYYRYLYLIHVRGNIAPSPDVDEVWHRHILHLHQYLNDCKRVFGKIIYHEPLPISLTKELANKVNPNCESPAIKNKTICQDGDTGELIDPPEYRHGICQDGDTGDLIDPPEYRHKNTPLVMFNDVVTQYFT